MTRIIGRTILGLLTLHLAFVLLLSSHTAWLSITLLCFAALAALALRLTSSPANRHILRYGSLALLLVGATFAQQFSSPQLMKRDNLAIVGAHIITGKADEDVINDGTVLIDNRGHITLVGTRQEITVPQNYKVIDAAGKYLMPGLINAHTHLWNDGDDPDTPLDVSSWIPSDIGHSLNLMLLDSYIGKRIIAYLMEKNVQKELRTGVTTVRGIGDIGFLDIALRDRITRGEIPGPNLVVAGKILAITGGHASDIGIEVDGPVAARKAVRKALHHKVDFIKITSTGGVSDSHRVGEAGELQMTPEEIQAIVDEAHRKNVMVAAHAESTQGVREALQAGVDNIEHGARLDDDMLELFKNNPKSLRGFTSLHPTLSIFGREVTITDDIKSHPVLSVMAHNAQLISDEVIAGFKQAMAHNILVGLGTDAGFVSHEMVWKEMKFFMNFADVSPSQAIHMGTLATAESIGIQEVTGSIEQGKRADLLIIDGDPREDLSLIGKPILVIANGYLYPDQ